MKVSVIIPTLNSPTLTATLQAVTAQTVSADEIIVVGCYDARICERFPDVRFIDTITPVSAAKARNIGIAHAQHELLLFCDSDCLPQPTWLSQHVKRHVAGEHVVGGSVLVTHPNYWTRSDNVSMFHEFVPGHPSGPRFMVPTLNLSVRRAVVEAVGELDESYVGAAGEDSDWSIRMRRAGYVLFFEPDAPIAHAPSRSQWADVVRHWRGMGAGGIRVRLRYADEYATPRFARSSFWLRALSPIIATAVTLKVYRAPGFWRYWTSLPVVFASKVIYCWSAAAALAAIDNTYANASA
jgi:glycosyltransferase involved in cell wall biosynthesis